MPIIIPYAFLGSFLVTVFALQWDIRTSYPLWIFGILGLVGIFGIFLYRKSIVLIAISLGITIALLSVSHAANRGQFQDLELIIDLKNIQVVGTVIGQPDDRGTKVQFVLHTTHVRLTKTGSMIPMNARVLITSRRQETMPFPGDTLTIRGRQAPIEQGSGYERYLHMRSVGAVIEMQTISVSHDLNVGSGHSSTSLTTSSMPLLIHLDRWLWHIKLTFQYHLRRVLPEPMAGLLDGLLTGSNGGLTERVQADFRTTGLSHIVAVSGSNITVILSVLSSMLFFLPLRKRFLPCVIGIILFTLFVGASASVVRAAVTGIIGLIALQSENQNDARLATLWTAFFMLCWNPWQLWADAGFQLSFLAVAGLIECTPILEPWLKKVPEIGGIREVLTATLAAQLTAVPWGIALFGAIPLISPISNVVVAPLIPLAMMTGAISLLIAFIMPPLTIIAGLPASLLLDGIIRAAHLMALIPGASIAIPAFPSWLMAVYYILLYTTIIILKKRITNDRVIP